MFICSECEWVFNEPDGKRICLEDYYGVRDLPGRHYGTVECCPECGCEDFEDYEGEEDDEE